MQSLNRDVNQCFSPGMKRFSSGTISADLGARLTRCQKARDLSEEDTNLILGEEASISGNEYPLACGDTLIVSFRYS